jgi:ribosome biogenesis protein SSF1/2
MAGPLGVSHLLLFSRSNTGNTNLRIALTPRGPTLHFRVEKYSLCKDVRRAMKHPMDGGLAHRTPPLLVMNNFMSPPAAEGESPAVPKHLESLTTTVFQSLFPPISPQSTPLSSIRRVLLLNRELPKQNSEGKALEDTGDYVINVRHYAITTKRTGLPKSIRKINAAEKVLKKGASKSGLPNLNKLEDIADYILDPSAATSGFTSGSDTEAETDAEVEVLETSARKILSKKQLANAKRKGDNLSSTSMVEKKAVKLVELGPRMKLRMTKVEEGVCGGKVMWHEYLTKSKEEIQEIEARWENRRKEKEERKRIQKENVARKRKEKEGADEDTKDDDEFDEDWDSEELENYEEGDDDDKMQVDGPLEVPIG